MDNYDVISDGEKSFEASRVERGMQLPFINLALQTGFVIKVRATSNQSVIDTTRDG